MTPIPATPRRALIHLKWALVIALNDGVPADELCRELGKPWTPELLAQAFPEVARKTEAAA